VCNVFFCSEYEGRELIRKRDGEFKLPYPLSGQSADDDVIASDLDDPLVDFDIGDRSNIPPVDCQHPGRQSETRRKNVAASKQEVRRLPLAADVTRRKATAHRRRKSVDEKQQQHQQQLAIGASRRSVAVDDDIRSLSFQTTDQYSCAIDCNPRGVESMKALVAFVNGSADTECCERASCKEISPKDMSFSGHKSISPYVISSGFNPSLTPPYDGEFDERLVAGSRLGCIQRQWNEALAVTSSSPPSSSSYYVNQTSADFIDHGWMSQRDCLEAAACATRTPSDGGYENICTPETPGWDVQTASPIAIPSSVVARKVEHDR
jgi:hypothetical protein